MNNRLFDSMADAVWRALFAVVVLLELVVALSVALVVIVGIPLAAP
ncbi:MAG: hypothetical protein JNK75_11865 [Betaproteobacteria bacterium]|nr:hypothetical protein [Betaproteobacteria bacterium]